MVAGLAFAATALASVFAESTLVRYTRERRPQLAAWAVALAMFALASAALAMGASTGWDRATFRLFFLFGAVLNVPWLALGTVYLLASPTAGRRAQWALTFFSGLAAGVLISAPMEDVRGTTIPVGKDVFDALPRVLAGIGSGVGTVVIIGGALWSVIRLRRGGAPPSQSPGQSPGAARRAGANVLIALGTLVLSSGGLLQGIEGSDEAFTASLAAGIAVIYVAFRLAEGTRGHHEDRTATGAREPGRGRGSWGGLGGR